MLSVLIGSQTKTPSSPIPDIMQPVITGSQTKTPSSPISDIMLSVLTGSQAQPCKVAQSRGGGGIGPHTQHGGGKLKIIQFFCACELTSVF